MGFEGDVIMVSSGSSYQLSLPGHPEGLSDLFFGAISLRVTAIGSPWS